MKNFLTKNPRIIVHATSSLDDGCLLCVKLTVFCPFFSERLSTLITETIHTHIRVLNFFIRRLLFSIVPSENLNIFFDMRFLAASFDNAFAIFDIIIDFLLDGAKIMRICGFAMPCRWRFR